jgi:glutaryl-CoA dehydrogenase
VADKRIRNGVGCALESELKMQPEKTMNKPEAPVTLPAPNGNFYQVTDSLSGTERAKLAQVRKFMETSVAPIINKYRTEDSFPLDVLPSIRDLKQSHQLFQRFSCRQAIL